MSDAYVSCNPDVMLGKPVIAGTRITVELLLERLAAGETAAEIYEAFPHLPPKSIEAALAYAAASIRHEVVIPIQRRSA